MGSPFPKLDRARELYGQIHDSSQDAINREVKYKAELYGRKPLQSDVLFWTSAPESHHELGVLAGELVHDVRSSLDQLVNDLIRERGQSEHVGAQFPILESSRKWKRQVTERDPAGVPCDNCGRVDGRASPLHGLSSDQVDFIGERQPFSWEKEKRPRHPLLGLSKMSNVDKHRSLLSCAVRVHEPTRVAYEPSGFFEAGDVDFNIGEDLVQTGQEFGRVQRRTISEPSLSQPVRIRLTGEAEWAFRVEGGLPIATVQDLGRMILFAAEILSTLSPSSPARSV